LTHTQHFVIIPDTSIQYQSFLLKFFNVFNFFIYKRLFKVLFIYEIVVFNIYALDQVVTSHHTSLITVMYHHGLDQAVTSHTTIHRDVMLLFACFCYIAGNLFLCWLFIVTIAFLYNTIAAPLRTAFHSAPIYNITGNYPSSPTRDVITTSNCVIEGNNTDSVNVTSGNTLLNIVSSLITGTKFRFLHIISETQVVLKYVTHITHVTCHTCLARDITHISHVTHLTCHTLYYGLCCNA